MTQPDLFDRRAFVEKFTRSGYSIVPPTREEIARQRGTDGMQRAADPATREWQDKAVGYVRLYAVVHAEFLAESARAMAEHDGLPVPPSKKAWGAVMQRAAREGIVERIGYAPACSSNGAPKCLWRALGAA